VSATSTSISGLPRESGAPRPEPIAFRLLAWGTIVCAVGILSAGLAFRVQHLSAMWPQLLAWIALVTLVDLLPVATSYGPRLDMDLPILLGAAFVFGPIPAGLVAFVGLFDAREFKRELSITCALYNRSQKALSVMAAALLFGVVDARVGAWPRALIAALFALLLDCVINYSMIMLASMLLHRTPSRLILSQMKFGRVSVFVLAYACLGLLGLILAETYVRLGPLALVSFPIPIVLARQAFSHGFGLDAAKQAIHRTDQAFVQASRRIAEERSDERSRIASSLHDDVLQSLYNVTIHAQVIREDLRAGRLLALDDDVPALLRASDEASAGLRDVIKDLRQSPLGRRGLIDTLTLLLDYLHDESGLRIVRSLGAVEASPAVQLVAYQAAKEAVVNAIRHASASAVYVTIETVADKLLLSVEDDGKGLGTIDAEGSPHFGIELMNERVMSVGGTLNILPRQPTGLRVQVELPANKDQKELRGH
jgi:signal transduction histidine kinase